MMGNQNLKPEHEKKPVSYPLVGREGLTEQQRSEFLRQARLDEQNYGPKDYQRPTDLENQFHNSNHPVNLKSEIAAHEMMIQLQSKNMEYYLQHGIESGALLEPHKNSLKQAQAMLEGAQNKLEQYYEANPDKRPNSTNTIATQLQQDNSIEVNRQGQGWHKVRVDASQPLQFSEAFRRTSEMGRDVSTAAKSTEFKPHVAETNARALYTHSGETDTNIAWHQKTQNFSYQQPVSGESFKRAGKLGLVAMGLTAAVEKASAAPGTLPDKLSVAADALKDIAIDAVPGVTYLEKMQAGKYQEAALDAASYLPLGDISGIARSPEAQAVIDALPQTREALALMMRNKAEAPINRHLAEYQLLLLEAKNEGDVFKGLSLSSRLTDLAEKKIVLQAEWAKNSTVFLTATSNPETDWAQVKKNNPEIASHVDIHLAAVHSGRPDIFVAMMDANLTKSLAEGSFPVLPNIAADKNHQAQEDMSLIK